MATAIALLTDLYFAWVASYVKRTRELTTYETEGQIEDLCIEYEKLKPYFIKKCGLD